MSSSAFLYDSLWLSTNLIPPVSIFCLNYYTCMLLGSTHVTTIPNYMSVPSTYVFSPKIAKNIIFPIHDTNLCVITSKYDDTWSKKYSKNENPFPPTQLDRRQMVSYVRWVEERGRSEGKGKEIIFKIHQQLSLARKLRCIEQLCTK